MNPTPDQPKTGSHCTWCGSFNEDNGSRPKRWRCEQCLRANLAGCPSCSLPIPEAGDSCPRCGVELPKWPTPPAVHVHSPMSGTLWPTKDWGLPDTEGNTAPPCPKCGEKLRPDGAARHGSHGGIGFCNPPWNAGWDGCCSACGHDLLVRIEQQTGLGTGREVLVCPGQRFHTTHLDSATCFSGVRIKVREHPYGRKPASESEVFLSMGELMELFKAIEGPAKAFKAQMDWTCDWT